VLSDRPCPAAEGAPAPRCCAELLCLLRLSEIALADPEPEAGLRAMAGELARLDHVERVWVALADGRGPGLRPLSGEEAPPDAVVLRATDGQAIAEEAGRHDGPGRSWAVVPILAADRALGVLGLAFSRPVLPLDTWRQHVLWGAADLMALVLLRRCGEPAGPAEGALRLTRRQRDVLFELVERGAANEEIGDRLGLSASTVKIHLQAVYRRLGVRSRGEAIRLVLTRHADWLARERQRRPDPSPSRGNP
jgi:DNA-binding CsgD family transcriptional regulator